MNKFKIGDVVYNSKKVRAEHRTVEKVTIVEGREYLYFTNGTSAFAHYMTVVPYIVNDLELLEALRNIVSDWEDDNYTTGYLPDIDALIKRLSNE